MNIPEMYAYLVRARRVLRVSLQAVSDEVLARPLLGGERFHCIKDLLLHIAVVEDGWVNGDIRRAETVLDTWPDLKTRADGPQQALTPLTTLLEYWDAVEARTLTYLGGLTPAELSRVVTVEDWPPQHQRFTVDGVLWHVLQHEIRHTAQIAVLLRLQGITPPTLDLLFYLPSVPLSPQEPAHDLS
ncbi:DinB family protein [Deinococcus hohokamensis]|uniref:DinB family protein n=1 Tax=Deinococcus hohokamensis TaxID=309883 RepID=A0ABV9IFQ9_9DEIO